MSNKTAETMNDHQRYCGRSKEKYLGKGRPHYEKNKDRPRKMVRDRNEGLTKEWKGKQKEYARNRYWNISEEDRQKLKKLKKRQIQGLHQEKLRQRLEQVAEKMKKREKNDDIEKRELHSSKTAIDVNK